MKGYAVMLSAAILSACTTGDFSRLSNLDAQDVENMSCADIEIEHRYLSRYADNAHKKNRKKYTSLREQLYFDWQEWPTEADREVSAAINRDVWQQEKILRDASKARDCKVSRPIAIWYHRSCGPGLPYHPYPAARYDGTSCPAAR